MKLLQALLFVCISFSAFSQKNYVKGYIILKNQADTLKGSIDDQNWSVNPSTISFINTQNQEKIYDISELEAFGVQEKEGFLVAKADLDITPGLKGQLLYSRNLIIKKDTLLAFLILLKAEYSLLYLKDNTDKVHFFYKEGQKITELVNHFFLEARDGKTYEFNNKSYQQQLEVLFNQCTKKIRTDNISYEINELTDKFVEFSECIGCTYTCYIKKNKDKPIFTFGVMAGVSGDRNTFIYESKVDGFYDETKVRAPNGMVGINFSISSRRNLKRNSFLLETYLTRERVSIEQINFSVDSYYLSISPRVRHQFTSLHRINPFVGGGFNGKSLISYPIEAAMFGAKLNLFFVGEAGLKWRNFLLSANVKLSTTNSKKISENLLILYYNGIKRITNEIRPEKINFQFSLTYLLYNSANKLKAKKKN